MIPAIEDRITQDVNLIDTCVRGGKTRDHIYSEHEGTAGEGQPLPADGPCQTSEGQPLHPSRHDTWEKRGSMLVRTHHVPRRAMFIPGDALDPPPVPLEDIDVTRTTTTDSECVDEKRIVDVWGGFE